MNLLFGKMTALKWFPQAGKAYSNPHPEAGAETPFLTSNASQNWKKAEIGPEIGCSSCHVFKSAETGNRTRSELPELELQS